MNVAQARLSWQCVYRKTSEHANGSQYQWPYNVVAMLLVAQALTPKYSDRLFVCTDLCFD
jgi:hypothetical protein